jgi:hypothetical protein
VTGAGRSRRVSLLIIRQGERDGREALSVVAELEAAALVDLAPGAQRHPDVEALLVSAFAAAFAEGVRPD